MFVLLFNALSGLEGCLTSPSSVAGEGAWWGRAARPLGPGWVLMSLLLSTEKSRQAAKGESTCVCFLCNPRDGRQTVNYSTWTMLVAEGIKDQVTRVRRSDCQRLTAGQRLGGGILVNIEKRQTLCEEEISCPRNASEKQQGSLGRSRFAYLRGESQLKISCWA